MMQEPDPASRSSTAGTVSPIQWVGRFPVNLPDANLRVARDPGAIIQHHANLWCDPLPGKLSTKAPRLARI